MLVTFKKKISVVKNIVIIGHHTSPKSALKEMDELYRVFQAVKEKWKTEVRYQCNGLQCNFNLIFNRCNILLFRI